MLFDLKGKRRRAVQVTYVGLAVLMGGGLVLSGIGSDASGGLLDAFVGDGAGGNTDAEKPFNNQVKAAEAALRTNPNDAAALSTLVRAHFGLAGLEQQEQDGQVVGYSDKGIAEIKKSEAAWARYLKTEPDRIDTGLAATAIQLYRVLGPPKDNPQKLVLPAREIAQQADTAEAYVNLVQVATEAGDTRTADLAERKALSYAQTKDEKATLKERIATAKASSQASDPSAGAGGAAPPSGGTGGP